MADEKEAAAEQLSSANEATKKMNGKHKALAVLLLIIITGLFFAARLYINAKIFISTDDAFVDAHVFQVSSRVPGTVKAVLVEDNQRVRKGDILVELDPAIYETSLKDAESSVLLSRNEVGADYATLGSAEANLTTAKSKLELAESDLDRSSKLFERGIISRQDLDKVTTDRKVAASAVKDAEDAVTKARSTIGLKAPGGVEAKIAQKKAMLDDAKLRLSYTRLYAPEDGFVTRKSVEVFNNIQAGQPLMAVAMIEDPWVVANFKESQLAHMKSGQPVDIEVDAYGGKIFKGKVDSIMAGTGAAFSLLPPENATGNYVKVVQRVPVKILVDRSSDPDRLLRVGMSVVPTIETGRTWRDVVNELLGK
jgi:membrane fusion protein, multidrug efflux system